MCYDCIQAITDQIAAMSAKDIVYLIGEFFFCLHRSLQTTGTLFDDFLLKLAEYFLRRSSKLYSRCQY